MRSQQHVAYNVMMNTESKPLECPHCRKLLTDTQVATLYGRMTNARRKVKSGGKNGGRRKDSYLPPSYVRAFPSTPEQRVALDAEIAAIPRFAKDIRQQLARMGLDA